MLLAERDQAQYVCWAASRAAGSKEPEPLFEDFGLESGLVVADNEEMGFDARVHAPARPEEHLQGTQVVRRHGVGEDADVYVAVLAGSPGHVRSEEVRALHIHHLPDEVQVLLCAGDGLVFIHVKISVVWDRILAQLSALSCRARASRYSG